MTECEYKEWLITRHPSDWERLYDLWLSLPPSVRGSANEMDTNYGHDAHIFVVMNENERDSAFESVLAVRGFRVMGYKWLNRERTLAIKHPTIHNHFETSTCYSWMKPIFRVEQETNFCYPI